MAKAKDCGNGVYIFGIPIIEGANAKMCRKNANQDHQENIKGIEEESDVLKEQAQQYTNIYESYFRNFGTGETPAEGVATSLFDAAAVGVPAALTGGLSLLTGSLGGIFGGSGAVSTETDAGTAVDLAPVVVAAGAALVVLMVVLSGDKKGGK